MTLFNTGMYEENTQDKIMNVIQTDEAVLQVKHSF